MMIRIALTDYERFIFQFYNVRAYGKQRLGQAFCNCFRLTNSNLFYELDNREALDLIETFVWNDSDETPTHTYSAPAPYALTGE